jgi:zinc protease
MEGVMWTQALIGVALALAAGRSTDPPKIEKQTLKNGLEVLVVENHAVPLVTIEIAARNGSFTEPPEYNGLSHLYEHMFFKANKVIPDQETWLARARELGLVWNGTTQTERVNYFFTTTSDHLADGMVFMRDATMYPLFDSKELERERPVVTGELDRNEANPFYHLNKAVSDRVWWKYPSRKWVIGVRKTILTATRQKMQTIQKRYYIPNNSVLVVTGDVKAADVFAQAEELYAGWKRGPDPFVKFPMVKHPPIKKTEVVLVEQPVQTLTGVITWHGPSVVGDEIPLTYAADVLSVAVGEPSSKFQQALVDSGACLGVGFTWFTQMNTGPISLNFAATPDKAEACVRAILAELPKMKAPDYLTDAEMRNAAHTIEVGLVRERERPSELAHGITFWWSSAGLDYYLGYVDHVYQASREEMARFMDRYVLGQPFVMGIMLSPEMRQKGLDAARFEALLAPPAQAMKEVVK